MTSRDMMKVVLYIARVLLISVVFRPITTRYYGSSTLYSLYLIGDSATPTIYLPHFPPRPVCRHARPERGARPFLPRFPSCFDPRERNISRARSRGVLSPGAS